MTGWALARGGRVQHYWTALASVPWMHGALCRWQPDRLGSELKRGSRARKCSYCEAALKEAA